MVRTWNVNVRNFTEENIIGLYVLENWHKVEEHTVFLFFPNPIIYSYCSWQSSNNENGACIHGHHKTEHIGIKLTILLV